MSNKKAKEIFDIKTKKEFLIAIDKLSVQKKEVIKTLLTHHSSQMTMHYINRGMDENVMGDN